MNIPEYLSQLTTKPGVYQMLNTSGEVIYVGKAQNLKKRVSQYFQKNHDDPKTRALVKQINKIEIITTQSDTEAYLLENNLIKRFRPRYNVVLRDDKSYPYIYVSTKQVYPRISFYRGARKLPGKYFGPYPSRTAVRETLSLLERIFKLRTCLDTFFKSRSRPCLQYQIKRCSAPCVGYISAEDYHQSVTDAMNFLSGKNQDILNQLAQRMAQACEALAYEKAAELRDQIKYLRRIQESQSIFSDSGEVDVIAIAAQGPVACVQVLSIRSGAMIGSKAYYPSNPTGQSSQAILSAFIPQYYLNPLRSQHVPTDIILSEAVNDREGLSQLLSTKLSYDVKGLRARWLEMTLDNAKMNQSTRRDSEAAQRERWTELKSELNLTESPNRIECFDISHTSGLETVGSCVVFDENGPVKTDYRRFNIKNITPGDDYAAMHQVLERRYKKLKESEAKMPDIILVDGGKGQLTQAEKMVENLQLIDVTVIAVAKGPSRKSGSETLIAAHSNKIINLPIESGARHLIQQIRDEAHRFAITGHRAKRNKQTLSSGLESIEGVGVKRRQALLQRFGGMQEIRKASVHELAKVPGVSCATAQRIYDHLHQ